MVAGGRTRRAITYRARADENGNPMGDKSPKSKNRDKKQDDAKKKKDKADHDAKQAPKSTAPGKKA